jgi:hypothetical protein
MFQSEVVEKVKTHILCSIIFLKNLGICEELHINIVEPDRTQMMVWRMRIACWITKATNIHSEYVILNCFSTVTVVAGMA